MTDAVTSVAAALEVEMQNKEKKNACPAPDNSFTPVKELSKPPLHSSCTQRDAGIPSLMDTDEPGSVRVMCIADMPQKARKRIARAGTVLQKKQRLA